MALNSLSGVDLGGNKITTLGSGTAGTDAANYGQLTAAQAFAQDTANTTNNARPSTAFTAAAQYATRSYLPVTNRTHFNGNGGSAATALIQTYSQQTRVLLKVISSGAQNLQVEWANIWTSNTAGQSEQAGPNSVNARFAVEYPAGNPRVVSGSTTYASGTAYALLDQVVYSGTHYVCIQAGTGQTPSTATAYWTPVVRYTVTFPTSTDGSGTTTFAPGAYLQSNPVPLTNGPTVAGYNLAVCGYFETPSTSGYIPYAAYEGGQNNAPYVDWKINLGTTVAAGSDICATGVTTQTNGNASTANWVNGVGAGVTVDHLAMPTAVTGDTPLKRCVGLFGDSLIAGFGGDWRDGSMAGWCVRNCDGATYWRIAQGGNKLGCYSSTISNPWQAAVLRRCTAVVCDMGINDIALGDTLAQVKTAATNCWQWLASAGAPLFQTMLSPLSNSSDTWTTLANQSQYTGSGTVATTQCPSGVGTNYTGKIYGGFQMWLTQTGAQGAFSPGGATVSAGQPGHPLECVIDLAGNVRDPLTGWKWNANGTSLSADGAHPTAYAVGLTLDTQGVGWAPVALAMQQLPQVAWFPNAQGGYLSNMERSTVVSTAATDANTALVTSVGVSPGRYINLLRFYLNATPATTTGKWAILAGTDMSWLQCIATGSVTYAAGTDGVVIGTIGVPLWVPPGQQLYVLLSKVASQATAFGGQVALAPGLNSPPTAFVVAGGVTDATLTLTVGASYTVANAAPGATSTFTTAMAAVTSRVWAELT